MSGAEGASPIASDELPHLFAGFAAYPRILIAVSGGPDSTALLHLACRWRADLPAGPDLLAATVDHGLRAASAAEAQAVAETAARLGVPHRTLLWAGGKPQHGLQEAARDARYGLLMEAARAAGAPAIALAHTLDDQAETVLFRLARGSGLTGLAGMRAAAMRDGIALLRPLLPVPKARLVATLQAAGLPFANDPSNTDSRFTRPRLRAILPVLAAEGLDARRLAAFARRAARADAALEAATDAAMARLSLDTAQRTAHAFDLSGFLGLSAEIALRLLGRAIAAAGTEGPVELAKLEALLEAVMAWSGAAAAPFRRTLAGALVTIRGGTLAVTHAPARRGKADVAPISGAPAMPVLGKKGART